MEHTIRWCFRRDSTTRDKGPLVAYQRVVNCGWMIHRVTEFTRHDGSTGARDQVYLTPAGAAKLAEILQIRRAA